MVHHVVGGLVNSVRSSPMVMRRLRVLAVAEECGNVSAACRRFRVSRQSVYSWRRRFAAFGVDGLRDRPPVHRSHPQTTSAAVERLIVEMALEKPSSGCFRIARWLEHRGKTVSGATVQKILRRHALGTRADRAWRLEEMFWHDGYSLSARQVAFVIDNNPCFCETDFLSLRPGALLVQAREHLCCIPGVGRVYLEAVVDSYGGFAFGFVHAGAHPRFAIAALRNVVLPQYRKWGLVVREVVAEDDWEYVGRYASSYTRFLVEQAVHKYGGDPDDAPGYGYMLRFIMDVRRGFLQCRKRRGFSSIAVVQREFDAWLSSYNQRAYPGFRNDGLSPLVIVRDYLAGRPSIMDRSFVRSRDPVVDVDEELGLTI